MELAPTRLARCCMPRAIAGWPRALGAKPAGQCENAAPARSRSRTPIAKPKKNLIERAYREGEPSGLAVWTQDEAGPYPTRPMPGQSWAEEGQARRQPHEYVRNGTAKPLTLFCPGSGEVRAKGVTAAPNAVLHPWLQQELTEVLDQLPPAPLTDPLDAADNHAVWQRWRHGLKMPITLPALLPTLRFAAGVGQPGRAPDARIGTVVVCARRDAVVLAAGRLVAEHGRVDSTHHHPSGLGRAVPADTAADHRYPGSDGQRLEPGPDAFSLGRQAPCAPFAQQAKATCPGRLGRLHTPSAATSAIGAAEITIELPTDPLAKKNGIGLSRRPCANNLLARLARKQQVRQEAEQTDQANTHKSPLKIRRLQ